MGDNCQLAAASSAAVDLLRQSQEVSGRRIVGPEEALQELLGSDQEVLGDLFLPVRNERRRQRDATPVRRDVRATLQRIVDASLSEERQVVDHGPGLFT